MQVQHLLNSEFYINHIFNNEINTDFNNKKITRNNSIALKIRSILLK